MQLKAVLITGEPKVGKSTALSRFIDAHRSCSGGVLTEELRNAGARVGFQIRDITSGDTAVMAHVDSKSTTRIGKYGVDVATLDRLAAKYVMNALADGQTKYVIIDEIGPMQAYSPKFRQAVKDAIDSPKLVIASIVLRSHPWSDTIKEMKGTKVIELTPESRDDALRVIEQTLVMHT